MNTQTVATAVAPTAVTITGKDIAVHTARTIGSGLHTGFTFLADVSKFATARIVNKLDASISVQDTDDYIEAKTAIRLEKVRLSLSGYKPVIIE